MPWHDPRTPGAHHRVLKQLCEALLCEGWASDLSIERKSHDRNGRIIWQFGSRLYQADGGLGAFGRYRLVGDSIRCRDMAETGTPAWHPASLGQVLDDVGATGAARETLLSDLRHTVRLTDLNAQEMPPRAERHALGVSDLETALIEGHPYHPCFKARSGFSDADHREYGPERGQAFRLEGILVDQSLVRETLPNGHFWRDELGLDEWNRVQARVAALGLSGRHCLLPVHPWQWRTIQDHGLVREWRDQGRLHQIGQIGAHYRATQSVRTLMNADQPRRAHLKTALAMRNTSSMRVLDPENVAVAPAISRWLGQVIASDGLFQTHYPLTILPEYAAIIAGRDTPLAGYLAAIWRQSPEGLGLPATQMMPLNALAMTEANGQPLIAPWIGKYGVGAWVNQLIRVVVLPVWHMMVAHGIGLEAHGQNLILHHDKGWPTGLIVRDFHDSLEYVAPLLSRPDLCPDLAAIDPVFADAPLDLYHRMASAEALRELVMDTLFVFNLADVSHLLMQYFGMAEKRFWRAVRLQLDAYATAHGMAARQAMFAPFARQIHAESLITSKINPGRDSYRHLVSNTLAASAVTSKDQSDVCTE